MILDSPSRHNRPAAATRSPIMAGREAAVEPTSLVSVVIPVHNGARTLARALESALAQRYPAVEVVVADDGSTDDTPVVAGRLGDRVRVVTQPNRGAAAARNLGIREARGEFVAFLDADDEYLPGRIEKGIAPLLADASVAATFCRLHRVYQDGTRELYGDAYKKCRAFPEHLWPSSHTQTSGATCRRSALLAVGPLDETLQSHDEQDLWIRLAEAFLVVEIAEPLAVFHDMPDSYSKRWDGERSEADYYRVIERALDRCPERYGPFRDIIAADAHLHWGILYLVRGNHQRARRFLRRSLQTVPTATAAALLAAAWLPHRPVRAMLKGAKRALRLAERGDPPSVEPRA
jgi:glycosyltransferase involved in cell wall biosynthesis